jgi:RimJ/RimL family protein N-acetyltransferase
MKKPTITYSTRLAGSSAELLVIEGMYETMTAGHLSSFHVAPHDEVIIASDDAMAVALIVFVEHEEIGEIWIHFGYCKAEYRRKGYYKACIDRMKKIAKERGYQRIHTATHHENKGAIESIKARGGELQYLLFSFPV